MLEWFFVQQGRIPLNTGRRNLPPCIQERHASAPVPYRFLACWRPAHAGGGYWPGQPIQPAAYDGYALPELRRGGKIDRVCGERESSGGGAVLGIIGGVLGNWVGSGSGRAAATAAGAIGGIAGSNIEHNNK